MPTPVFPTRLFAFVSREQGIERSTLRGGTAISGAEDIVSTDGGGRVYAEFAGGQLVDRAQVLAWRSMQAILDEGVSPIIVPFGDKRHTPYGGEVEVPHSDGTPFSDGGLYFSGGPSAVTVGAAALRATSIRLTVTALQPLIGGEWFSIEHPLKGWRAYRIATIAPDGTTTFRPPLREAVGDGVAVELSNPRCLMVQDAKAGSKLDFGRYTEAGVRFVEAP